VADRGAPPNVRGDTIRVVDRIRARQRLGRIHRDVRWSAELCGLPVTVAIFQWRARRLARRSGDRFSLSSATVPRDLRALLALAASSRTVVELGTGTGWTAISLALAASGRSVISYDVEAREIEQYLRLVPASVRERISLGVSPKPGPALDERDVDFLYVDSSHEYEQTLAEWQAWRPHLSGDAVVVFDDYVSDDYPGVRRAVEALGLGGRSQGRQFVHGWRDGRR
jgi:predicted O-methyltransferase YrrM